VVRIEEEEKDDMQIIDRDNMLFDSVTSDGWRGPGSA
jgi:hypothetical protein